MPNFFASGGGTGLCRFFSRHIAIQIKAALLGQPFPLYTDTPETEPTTNGKVEVILTEPNQVEEFEVSEAGAIADVAS